MRCSGFRVAIHLARSMLSLVEFHWQSQWNFWQSWSTANISRWTGVFGNINWQFPHSRMSPRSALASFSWPVAVKKSVTFPTWPSKVLCFTACWRGNKNIPLVHLFPAVRRHLQYPKTDNGHGKPPVVRIMCTVGPNTKTRKPAGGGGGGGDLD